MDGQSFRVYEAEGLGSKVRRARRNPIMKQGTRIAILLATARTWLRMLFFCLYIHLQNVYNQLMPLSIRNSEVERLARSLSRLTGEGLTQTILQALRERHQRVRAARQQERLLEDLTAIARRAAALPELDRRSPDEIIGYDEHGLPK